MGLSKSKDTVIKKKANLIGDLLTDLDGMRMYNEPVVILASTNRVDMLEGALSDRPGRFDRKIELGLPTPEHLGILYNKFSGLDVSGEVIDNSEGFTGAHVVEAINTARILSAHEDKELIDCIPEAVNIIRENFFAGQPVNAIKAEANKVLVTLGVQNVIQDNTNLTDNVNKGSLKKKAGLFTWKRIEELAKKHKKSSWFTQADAGAGGDIGERMRSEDTTSYTQTEREMEKRLNGEDYIQDDKYALAKEEKDEGYGVNLSMLIDDDGTEIDMSGKAIEGEGIFDEEGKEYPAGRTENGELYASIVDTDNTVINMQDKRMEGLKLASASLKTKAQINPDNSKYRMYDEDATKTTEAEGVQPNVLLTDEYLEKIQHRVTEEDMQVLERLKVISDNLASQIKEVSTAYQGADLEGAGESLEELQGKLREVSDEIQGILTKYQKEVWFKELGEDKNLFRKIASHIRFMVYKECPCCGERMEKEWRKCSEIF